MNDFLVWFSVVSLIINIILILISVGLFVANKKEKERRNSQVKIWMQSANGIAVALDRILANNAAALFTSVQDMANTVHSVNASAFSLYQSLYEERVISREDYKKEQAAIRESFRPNPQTQNDEQQTLPLPSEADSDDDSPSDSPKTSSS